jgi:peroxiredoxin
MREATRSWRVLVLAGIAMSCLGCGGSGKSDGTDAGKGQAITGTGQNAPVEGEGGESDTEKPERAEPPPPPTIPKVVMEDSLRTTCLVFVGDKMPDAELPDLEGKSHPLSALLGKKLSVVVFWSKENLYGLQELGDLSKDVIQPYADKGVAVVAVNVGDTAQAVRQAIDMAGAKLPVLLDTNGAYFARVAKERLPRTYVLDAEGKVLWFDTEYSESTSRGMLQTIRVALGEIGKP